MNDDKSDGSAATVRYRRLAWVVVWLTVLVILGGSVVRASDSGSGCGDSWPRCAGSIIPMDGSTSTYIELTHRLMTVTLGLALAALAVWTLRRTSRGAPVRRALLLSGVFFVGEVLIGALIVLFGWTVDDASLGRTIMVPVHLINTFFLLGALALTAELGRGGPWPRFDMRRPADRLVLAGAAVMLIVAASGALNALADSVFPADSFLEGIAEEFGPAAPFLLRVRLVHPAVAVMGGLALLALVRHPQFDPGRIVTPLVNWMVGIVLLQFAVGIVNVAMATPIEVQVIHLLVANALWLLFVVSGIRLVQAAGIGVEPARTRDTR